MADENALEIMLKAVTAGFDRAIDSSRAKVAQFTAAANKSGAEATAAIGKIEKAGHAMNGVFGELVEAFAGVKILEFFKGVVDAAGEAEERVATLNQALENNGKFTAGAGEQLEKYATNLSKASGYALPQLIQGMANFANEGLNANQIMYASGLAANIAAAKHIDLATAQQVLARAIATGSAAGLARLGIHLDGVNLKTASLNDVMGKLGDVFAGQAAAHANTYEGAMARLGTTMEELKATFGRDLLGSITGVLNGMVGLMDVFEALSPEARQVIEAIGVAIGVFSAVSLVLPLVVSMFNAWRIAVVALGGALEFLWANPIGLVIGGIVALIAVIVLLVKNWSAIKTAASEAFSSVADQVRRFVDFVKGYFEGLGHVFHGVWRLLTGDKGGFDEMKSGLVSAGNATIKEWDNVKSKLSAGADFIKKKWGDASTYLKHVFTMGKVVHPTIPSTTDPGGWDQFDKDKSKDTSGKDESNAIGNLKDQIADQLQPYQEAIDETKDHIDALKAAEDLLRASFGEGGPTLAQQKALLANLGQQAAAATQQSKNYAAEIGGEKRAIAELSAARDKIAGNKKLQSQYRELSGAIREHMKAIRSLTIESIKAQVESAQALAKRNADEDAYHKKAIERLNKEIELRRQQRADENESNANARANAAAMNPDQTPVQKAADQVANATDEFNAAAANLREAQAAVAAAKGQDELDEANSRLEQATRDLAAAQQKVTAADIELTNAQKAANKSIGQDFVDKLKQASPELTEFINNLKNSGNPLVAMIETVITKTKSFQEILTIIGNIFNVIGQILDAIFLPVIQVVAKVLTSIVNVFITLWNVVATLVSLLGIHVDKLRYINSLLDDLSGNVRPLIDVVHDAPTLKEDGAGTWGPLEPDQYGNATNLPSLIQQQTANQGSWFGSLIAGVGALLLIDWLTGGKFGQLQTWLTDGWNFLQGVWTNLNNALGGKLGALVGIGAGIGLLTTHTSGMLGVLEKILGAVLLIQSIVSLVGSLSGGSAGSTLGGLLGLVGGGGSGGIGGIGSILSGAGSGGAGGLGSILNTQIGSTTIGAAILPALAGVIGGQLFGNLFGGGSHTTNGSILGGAGSVIGSIFGGPIGGWIGAGLGSLIGSLFGNSTSPQKNPDIYYSQQLSQGLANVGGGPFTANGTTNVEDASLKQALGGQTEGGYIASFIKNNPQLAASILSPSELSYFTSSGGNYGQNYEKNGEVKNTTNGQEEQWTQVISDANDAVQKIATAVQNQQSQSQVSATQGDPTTDSLIAVLTNLDQTLGTFAAGLTGTASTAAQAISTGASAAVTKPIASPIASPIAGGKNSPGLGIATSSTVTQNNTFGNLINQGDFGAVAGQLGRSLAIGARTNRYSYVRG